MARTHVAIFGGLVVVADAGVSIGSKQISWHAGVARYCCLVFKASKILEWGKIGYLLLKEAFTLRTA